ncbi:MAG: peptidoglycan bridge formation glycyltransferase FemA/FemB family protein [Treponemataceae bacterium]|nr:peptidoglycan bridge formation glycyltransferase FemA/FemB family protein [Treponemataceae bacterium]
MIALSKVPPETFPPSDNLFQTHFWGSLKEGADQKALYFQISFTDDENKSNYIPLLVLLRKIRGQFVYAYVQRAPEEKSIPADKTGFLEDLSEALRPHLPETVIFIRYDLPWLNPDPGRRSEMLEIMMNYGSKYHNLHKAPSNHLSSSTCILNLGPSPQQILNNMRQQTRNSIRRAYREEVSFIILDAMSPDLPELLEKTYLIYKDTALRKNFYFEKFDYFDKLFKLNKDFIKPKADTSFEKGLVPLDAVAPPPKFYLFTAKKDKTLLSSLILAICGSNAYYMYAASSMNKRECMPNYGLQWEVIRFARSQGCTRYDFMGIPPKSDSNSPMAGLYIFKTGFGGAVTHYAGAWDYPLKKEEYQAFRINETLLLRK